MRFINRENELKELSQLKGLVVVYGRRRVGKTSLITHWLNSIHSVKSLKIYTQAIEATPSLQLDQIYNDISRFLSINIRPQTWAQLFELIDSIEEELVLCIDEFPYLIKSDSSVASIFQKWIDHSKKKNKTIILCGSSTSMMYDLFLDSTHPLYARASKVLNIKSMSYSHFCKFQKLPKKDPESFVIYSLIGGIPKYWEFIKHKDSIIEQAERLYFSNSPYMQYEPRRILKDEGFESLSSFSILEAIGRGAHKSSEISNKLQTKQSSLSRLLHQLSDTEIIKREIPYGESERNSKKSLYDIEDAAIKFWYGTYSPHRTRWLVYSKKEKEKLLKDHASKIFEKEVRKTFPSSGRYWEKDIEIDLVYPISSNKIAIGEVKFKSLTKDDKEKVLETLKAKWYKTKLSKKLEVAEFKVIDQSFLNKLD